MNKLVIVGNGFDLAHGLPTSYKHFVDDFWKSLKEVYTQDEIKNVVFVNSVYYRVLDNPINNYEGLQENLAEYSSTYGYRYKKDDHECYLDSSRSKFIFKFENEFFKEINVTNSIENWVDIENEYYQKLKKISKQKPVESVIRFKRTVEEQKIENIKQAKKLNLEFEQIKILFEEYLLKKVTSAHNLTKFINRNWIGIHNFIKPISLFNNESRLSQEFLLEDDWEQINNLFEDENNGSQRITHTYVLNFNYTLTTSQYVYDIYEDNNYSEKIIHIHGILSNKTDNPMNFGFGDEMDEDYKLIENLNSNEYLENFKSFKYSQNSNYQNLLRLIESGKFQVLIMGHSCGLSDRTLLNTIFEHQNCRSIKVFYHDRGDGTDNFTEIIQNISRHFNDKKMMREKIVNKSLCKPLPQNIRFQEKKKT